MSLKHYFSAANILSPKTRENCLETIKKIPSLKQGVQNVDNNVASAAVLVPLCKVKGEIALLYTLRSMDLSSHKGQVSFPGGKYDQSDGSLKETALRETEEELGISRKHIEVWGEMGDYPSKNFEFLVRPVIGFIKDFDELELKLNPSEVSEAFTVNLENIADRQYFGHNTFKNGWTIPVFMAGPHKIWGLTAVITHIFMSSLLPKEAYPMRFQYLGYLGKTMDSFIQKSNL